MNSRYLQEEKRRGPHVRDEQNARSENEAALEYRDRVPKILCTLEMFDVPIPCAYDPVWRYCRIIFMPAYDIISTKRQSDGHALWRQAQSITEMSTGIDGVLRS